jgi:hypothetical protein
MYLYSFYYAMASTAWEAQTPLWPILQVFCHVLSNHYLFLLFFSCRATRAMAYLGRRSLNAAHNGAAVLYI